MGYREQLTRCLSLGEWQVDRVFAGQDPIPDMLYCVAGGSHAENGFLVDIRPSDLESCMANNYFTAAYAAKSMLDVWIKDDRKESDASPGVFPREKVTRKHRQIVFISSAATFVCLPGSVAYSPAKCAVRALADTLRLEAIYYSNQRSKYSIHCAFPGDFLSPGFYLEQDTKMELTKRIQGLAGKSMAELEAQCPSSDKVASLIVAAVQRGNFIICEDSIAASLLFTSMVGPSPKRGWGIFDSCVGVVVNWVVWPVLRLQWQALCRRYGFI
ncbi:putative short chain dehydrogenase/ reductase [Paramyrothecium foliicola]|nr:putative short chain dehydrogenase/ reductase [Paramyrothecium foliicola]